jgi:hypothetical protein
MMAMYFAKRTADGVPFGSTRGFYSLSEAMVIAIEGGYQVVEERRGAR